MRKALFATAVGLAMLGVQLQGATAKADTTTDVNWTNTTFRGYWCGQTGNPNAIPRNHGTTGADTYDMPNAASWPGGGPSIDACYFGWEGNDTVFGTDANNPFGDIVIGGPGGDTIWLKDGVDTGSGGEGTDEIHGYAGPDYIYGGNGADLLTGNQGDDLIWGGEECDETNWWGGTIQWFNSDPQPNVSATCGTPDGADTIQGGDGNDFLYDSNSDVVSDTAIDHIDGGAGTDDCTGGPQDVFTGCETIHVVPNGHNP